MDNASLILQALDGHLSRPASLVLYGRAAIQLGFTDPPREVAESKDVDAIIPLAKLDEFLADDEFWDAQEATNNQLQAKGLYITHLFRADQVILRPDWEQYLIPITRPPTRWLRLFRLATFDLILSKMMRGEDPQDLADVAFMIRRDRITAEGLEKVFNEAVLPDLIEVRDAFEQAKPRVLELARQGGVESRTRRAGA